MIFIWELGPIFIDAKTGFLFVCRLLPGCLFPMVPCVHNMLITLDKCSLQFTFSTGPQLSVHGVQTYQRRLAHSQSVKSECFHVITFTNIVYLFDC